MPSNLPPDWRSLNLGIEDEDHEAQEQAYWDAYDRAECEATGN